MSLFNDNQVVSFFDDMWGVDRIFNDRYPVTAPKIKVNLVEHPDKYIITADIPGIPKENVVARFDNLRDTITITTNTSSEMTRQDDNTGKIILSERWVGTSSRSIPLRRGSVDYKDISAEHVDGVLTITIKKLSEEQMLTNLGNITIN